MLAQASDSIPSIRRNQPFFFSVTIPLLTGLLAAFPTNAHAENVIPTNPIQTLNHFFFTPYGAQLDGDTNCDGFGHNPVNISECGANSLSKNIYDIEYADHTPLDFDVWLATKAPDYPAVGTNITSFSFNWSTDINEYVVQHVDVEPEWRNNGSGPGVTGCSISQSTLTGSTGTFFVDQCVGTTLSRDASISNFIKVFTLRGTTVHVGISPHDGARDFYLHLSNLKYGSTPDTLNLNEFQDVEVQTPAPLPALGITAAFASIRRLRKLSKAFR